MESIDGGGGGDGTEEHVDQTEMESFIDKKLQLAKSVPLIKYNDETIEIPEHQFVQPRNAKRNHIFFHPPFTAGTLATHVMSTYRHKSHQRELGGGVEKKLDRKTIEINEVLNAFMAPKDWAEDSKFFRQKVSTAPSTQQDVKELGENFEKLLVERYANETGICLIRRQIFTELFDELLRQVIVENPTMGVLLARIRDELRLTVDSYKALCHSMDVYSLRKGVQLETYRKTMEGDESVSAEIIELRKQHGALLYKFNLEDEKYSEMLENEKKGIQEELAYWKSLYHMHMMQFELLMGIKPDPIAK